MKILLVHLKFPDTFGSFKHALTLIRKNTGVRRMAIAKSIDTVAIVWRML